MKRTIDFPCDAAWIKNPNNSPLATPGQRMAAAARTKLCIETIGLILSAHFSKPPRHYLDGSGFTRPNAWTVRLVRISMGTLDPITGGASMKAVQDAIARWCEAPNERDPVWRWIEPIEQEKRGWIPDGDGKRAWTGVRIELEDLTPHEPRIVKLASIDDFVARAKANIKAREIRTARPTSRGVYHAEDAAKGASSSARAKAERAFAKVTGKAREAARRIAQEDPLELGDHHADARRPTPPRPDRDPGEERSAKSVTGCTTCGAAMGFPCVRSGVERLVFGVHVARARAAGLYVPEDDRGAVKPARAPRGARKLAPVAQLPLQRAFVALPWEQPACRTCFGADRRVSEGLTPCADCPDCAGTGRGKGRVLARAPRYDGLDEPPTTITAGVPSEHVARYGTTITLTREPFTSPQTGRCWLYTTTKETT